MRLRWRWLALLSFLSACAGEGTFYVTIAFPDEAAREQTRSVRVRVMSPTAEATCAELLAGTLQPGSEILPIEDEVVVSYPDGDGARPLRTEGPGVRMFLAEAMDAAGAVALHGCATAENDARAREVIIELVRVALECELDSDCEDGLWCTGAERCLEGVCSAEPPDCGDGDACTQDLCDEELDGCQNPAVTAPPAQEGPGGDASCGDGLDNDCDGLTDEGDPGCTPCSEDLECDDLSPCTDDTCVGGECRNDPVASGQACDDGLFCTTDDGCTNGLCRGEAYDCSAVEDQCNRSLCDEVGQQCVPLPYREGLACDDGRWCTEADACAGGACAGAARDCSALGSACVAGVCDEGQDACVGQPLEDGEPCDDGLYCTREETCTGGTCGGGNPRDCSASGGGCVDGVCNEDSDACEGTPLPQGTGCDDEVRCTANDTCDGDGGCAGVALDCSALDNQCNAGTCEEASGTCAREPAREGEGCDDGLHCTVGETCRAGACQPAGALDCGDGDGCTQDTCDEANDRCDHLLVQLPGAEGLGVPGTCADGLDNDCDRSTDLADPDCQECSSDGDCDDGNPCTSNLCVASQCTTTPAADGTPCDDGAFCSEPDACTAGVCGGPDLDCSALDGPCSLGVCDELDDQCQAQPAHEGLGCDDGLFCTQSEVCAAGTCGSGAPIDCSAAGDACHVGVCNEDEDRCEAQAGNEGAPCEDGQFCTVAETCQGGSCNGGDPRDCSAVADDCNNPSCDDLLDACVPIPKAEGFPCQDGIGCTTGDQCDGAGGCAGTESDAFCEVIGEPGDQCRPGCFAGDPTGCGAPPAGMVLMCAPDPAPVATTAWCDLALGIPDQLPCLGCSSSLRLVLLDAVGFDGCDLGGWSLVAGAECSTGVASCGASGSLPCCTNLATICGQETNGNWRLVSDEATNACGTGYDEQWRLQKTFDLTGLAQAEVCYFQAESQAMDMDEGVLVYACDGPSCTQIACHLDEVVPGADWAYRRFCAPLPGWAVDHPAVTVKFVVHSDDMGDLVALDRLSVKGWAQGCAPSPVQLVLEDFSGCPGTLPASWNGWTVTGTVPCLADFTCYNSSTRARALNTTGSLERRVDASAVDGDLTLCFHYGDDNAVAGNTLRVETDSGGGWRTLAEFAGNPGNDLQCVQYCYSLSEADPAVLGNPDLGLRFTLVSAGGGELNLDHIVLTGLSSCPGAGLVELGALNDNGDGTYFFSAEDVAGLPTRASLECVWADPLTGVLGQTTLDFE